MWDACRFVRKLCAVTSIGLPLGAALAGAAAAGCDLTGAKEASDSTVLAEEVAGPAPDYVVSRLGNPPPAAVNGAFLTLATTVANIGDAAAVADSTTRYFLSADTVIGDDISVIETATVPPLAPAEQNSQSVSLAIPSGVPGGAYFLLACADRRNTIPELDDHNNCASTASPVAVTGPDLVVIEVADPPASLEPGGDFSIADSIRNQGAAVAAWSLAGYYLSPTPARGPGARRLSTTRREVGPLAAGQTSSGSVLARIPEMPPGSYYVVACADISSLAAESDEDNNCTASATTTAMGPADLVISSVSDPPAEVAPGGSFFALDTTSNVGLRAASPSTNRFFLSADDVPGEDIPIAGTRDVPTVPAGQASSGWADLSLDPAIAPGDYFLVVCADATAVVAESSEGNNCRVSASSLTVPEPEETTCGDGQITTPEQCDDGNAIDDDGCDRDCRPTAVVQVVAGLTHSCARMRSGGVRCWGQGGMGQLGYGNTDTIGDNEFPRRAGSVQVGGKAVELTAGYYHTCARLDTGAVRCWGWGINGALGYGNTDTIGDDETPASVGNVRVGAPALEIDAGSHHTCARLVGDTVRCWGDGTEGRLGYGNRKSVGDDETPASVGDVDVGGPVVEISAGGLHTCARLAAGGVRCWGRGGEGQLGYANTTNIGDNEAPVFAGDVEIGGDVVEISAGDLHTCARMEGGTVRCWGSGFFLGYGNTNTIGDDETPASAGDIAVGGRVVAIAAGGFHTCARLETGGVRCWGYGGFGALGYGNTTNIGDNETPASAGDVVLEGRRAVDLAAGTVHNCALFAAGRVRCWGFGDRGQLGYGNLENIGDNELPASAGSVQVF